MNTPINEAVELLPCPFCAGAARVASNNDWHRVWVAHADDCTLDPDEAALMYPATPLDRVAMVERWNRRAALPPPIVEPVKEARSLSGIEFGYQSGLLTSDADGEATIHLHYATRSQGEAAFDIIVTTASAPSDGAADARVQRLLNAAKVYAFNYCQDEAEDEESCVCGAKQHAEAKELFAAIAAFASTHTTTGGEGA